MNFFFELQKGLIEIQSNFKYGVFLFTYCKNKYYNLLFAKILPLTARNLVNLLEK